MNNILLRLLVIVLVCIGCGAALWTKSVRLGKDLRGGASLIYAVKLPEGGRREEMLTQVIDVLKQRVNPQGVLDIAMNPQGLDRIEVVMPLPSPEVRALQRAYQDALHEFIASMQISPTELDQALAAGKAPERYGSTGTRGDDVKALQKAYDDGKAAREELTRATAAGADPAAIAEVENRVVTAELAETRLRSKLLGQTLAEARLLKTLSLSTEPQPQRDPATGAVLKATDGKVVMGPSLRAREFDLIKAEFPHLGAGLDALIAKHDAYYAKRTGLDDPEDLMRLLRGAGVLEFHIAVQPGSPLGVNVDQMREQLAKRGPRNTDSATARWYEINDLKQWYETPEQLEALTRDPIGYFAARGLAAAQYAGTYWILLYTTDAKSMTHSAGDPWSLQRAFRTTDSRLGGVAVGFQLDSSGATRMAKLTGPHVNQPMAIVLDDQVYSAPNLNSQISGSGVITGRFSDSEIKYLIQVLSAGALEASISSDPISVNILGPAIGSDNLEKGKAAVVLSIAVVCAIMFVFYFLPGLIANIALAIHALIIFGVMAAIDGTFTMPGLAGIALSMGMAVDANVLVYERMREELVLRGESVHAAVALGFRRALSAIVDSNVTNLIAVVVLYKIGATEVKGFALTMCIGAIGTVFTGVFVSHTLFMVADQWLKVRRLPMLQTVWPAVTRALTPRFRWVENRVFLFGIAGTLSTIAIVAIATRGRDIFETEFRGGVALTLSTRPAASGEEATPEGTLVLLRQDVEDRVRKIGEKAGTADPILYELRTANVVTLGEAGAESRSGRFQIRVGNPPTLVDQAMEAQISRKIVEAIVTEFAQQLAVQLPLKFKGAGDADHAAHTHPLDKDLLGDCIGRPDIKEPLGDFRGGVVVVVDDIQPPVTTTDVEKRITRMRSQPDFSDIAGRKARAVGLTPADPADPSKGYTSMAILVSDPAINSLTVEFEGWDKQLAATEWRLIASALSQQASLDEVSSFSPIVAENLAASAIVAVVISLILMLAYIWIRFGSLRHSSGAVLALCFNISCCIGFLAISPWLAQTAVGRFLLIDEFRIDINVIAALLTIVGYDIMDSIVILDRVRENRGKLPYLSAKVIDDSVNQTFSRTLLTGGTTFSCVVILIIMGGTGIRPFAYTFAIGLLAGTASSVIVAAPLVYSRRAEEEERAKVEMSTPGSGKLPAPV